MERIAQMIRRGAGALSGEELEELAAALAQQPYYQAAHMLYTHAMYLRHDKRYGTALRTAAITLPDRSALAALIEGGKGESQPAQRRQANADRTESLITGFLDSLPKEKTAHHTVADASTDYMSYLLQTEGRGEDNNATMSGQELIDGFIGQSQGRRIALADRDESELLTPEKQETGEFFTETMARIYIKQGKYDKALKIIEGISTKVPRKNAYFADQMRFLRLLIENNKYNKQ